MKEPRNEREAHAALMRMPALSADVLGDGDREPSPWPILAIWWGAVAIICVATFFTG